ncbi:MAG: endonuclease III domain-containing protein [bacterium]
MFQISKIYSLLFNDFGRQEWWPADSPGEVIIGAVLTQNTSWLNVEKAITNLKGAELCSLESISKVSIAGLRQYIRPAGFYNQKSRYLINISRFFIEHYSENTNTEQLREQLLSVKGIGPETADSILLYALNRPVFVVDAYTRRMFSRHFSDFPEQYEDIREVFEYHLKRDVSLYKEYHALIVRCCKTYCRTKPLCGKCPIKGIY